MYYPYGSYHVSPPRWVRPPPQERVYPLIKKGERLPYYSYKTCDLLGEEIEHNLHRQFEGRKRIIVSTPEIESELDLAELIQKRDQVEKYGYSIVFLSQTSVANFDKLLETHDVIRKLEVIADEDTTLAKMLGTYKKRVLLFVDDLVITHISELEVENDFLTILLGRN